ncbi:response regulator [Methylomagnum ishizawai]|uniref:response regulator n=1 Tax=Methylomagnum ishizawai TaxID=1760988 RepID=UPI001C31F8EA|nr:response regulator transcription factor [Methylomagnum ishizawai]BBL74216.1 DNA-binding response regulator [Methylomagnum ishizawai]
MRIIIADDHMIFRAGLKLLLGQCPDYRIVAETGTAETLKALVREHGPELLILDYNMPGGNVGETLAYLKQRHPELRVLMLTAERSGALLKHLAGLGADGIFLKEGTAEALLAAVRTVGGGGRLIPDNVRERIDQADLNLTAREFQVLHLICAGWANPAIAERFSLSTRTVDKHRENILRKLGVNNVVQLIRKVEALGLFESLPDG